MLLEAEKAKVVMYGGVIHTLIPVRWPAGDHRKQWKWRAFMDGRPWRLFKTVNEWRSAVPAAPCYTIRGPHADATDVAVTWSEHAGQRLLEKLTDGRTISRP